jgi:pyruvate-formate lyase-activating enzyme
VQLPVAFAGRRWLEIALDYRCNLRCLGCHACHDTGERLASSEVVALLRSGRARGIQSLWLGGGEPTLRDDLLSLVRAARELGYAPIALQTNGMRLSYADYRAAVVRAGVTEVRFNVKSHRAEVHDRLSGGECHALLLEALAGLAGTGVRIAADVLLTKATAADLPETISFFASRGVETLTLWLLSAADAAGEQSDEHAAVTAEVPRIADVVPALTAARAEARRCGVELTSLHTPPCTLPGELRDLFRPSTALSLVVVGPDRRPFALESSPFEGGAFLEGCSRCTQRPVCGGPRADYLRLHGGGEFEPLAERELSGHRVSSATIAEAKKRS